MEKLQKNFFWISVCASLLLIHMTFIIFEVNVYMYLFWPYIVLTLGTLILAAIVFSKMEKIMKEIGPEIAIAKYKRIFGSLSFWFLFVSFGICIGFGLFSLGQLFFPRDLVSELITDKFVYWVWSIFLITLIFVIQLIAKLLKLIIYAKTK